MLAAVLTITLASAADLSLADAFAQAKAHNPDLRSAALTLDGQRAAVQSALATSDPVLTLSTTRSGSESAGFIGGSPFTATTDAQAHDFSLSGQGARGTAWTLYSGLDLDDTTTVSAFAGPEGEARQTNWTTETGIQLQQDLLVFWRRTPQLEARLDALAAVERAQLQAWQTEQTVLADVAEGWWDAWLARERVAVAERTVAEAQRLLDRTEALVAAGSAMPVEQSRARLSLLEAQRTLLTTRATADSADDQLLLKLGLTPDTPLQLQGTPTIPTSVPDLAAVLSQSPQRAVLQRDLVTAERKARDARLDRLPDLSLSVSGGFGSLEETAPEALLALAGTDRFPRWSTGLSLSVPLGNRAAKATADSRSADVLQAELALHRHEASLRADHTAALAQLDASRAALDIARLQVDVARETEAHESARVDAGTRRLDVLLDARDDRHAAELGLLEAQVDVARASLRLARLAGTVHGVR